jgi:hypothetical protein
MPSLPVGGGIARSASHRVELAVGSAGLVRPASSRHYTVSGGVFGVRALSCEGPPVVFGVHPRSGAVQEGQPARLLGFRLEARRAGGTAVRIGGAHATLAGPGSSTCLDVVLPPGLDARGNPLGAVPVSVVTQRGTASAERGIVHGPALVANAPARCGGAVDLSLLTRPGAVCLLVTGSPDGRWKSIPGVEGAFGLPVGTLVLAERAVAVTGELRWTVALPDDPALEGQVFQFQGLSALPERCAFTNVLDVRVLP